MILNRHARACLEENVRIEVLETWVSVVQVVQSFHSDAVLHNLHNQRPVFEQWSFSSPQPPKPLAATLRQPRVPVADISEALEAPGDA
jgi:hypothetical protein